MNEHQYQMYSELMALTDNEAFYFQDFPLDGDIYRIFNYRMASYSDFLLPSGLMCRGVMFRLGEEPALVSYTQEKFFNLNENPFTMDLDLNTVVAVEDKADGSLISTFVHQGELRLKSKGSIASEQAVDAMKWLDREENRLFKAALFAMANNGFTVNMEWCAPFNRIVIAYQEPKLTILNIRYNADGTYVGINDMLFAGPSVTLKLAEHWIDIVDIGTIDDMPEFVRNIPDMEDTEGYIIKLASGQSVKIKTHWYLVQHRAKDSINSDRRLFETVVADAHDDLRSLFADDNYVLERIQWMEDLVGHEYNHMVATVEEFVKTNKGLDRKDFAIKAKAEVKPLWFGLCMSLYLDKPVDFKGFMMSKWREYGFKDQQKGEL